MVRKCHRVTKVKKKKKKNPHSCRSKVTLWDVCLASVCLVVSSAGSEFCVSYNRSLNSTDEGSDGGQTVARQKQKHLTVGDEIIMIKKKEKKKDAELNNHCGLLKRILLLHACLCPALMCWWLKKKKKKKVSSVFKTSPWVLNRGSGLNRKSS